MLVINFLIKSCYPKNVSGDHKLEDYLNWGVGGGADIIQNLGEGRF